jgi:hypothetical protein
MNIKRNIYNQLESGLGYPDVTMVIGVRRERKKTFICLTTPTFSK